MDVLIKGMEMPKNYPYRLTLHSDGHVEDHTGYSGHGHYQAIELPPHGRLGDLDKLLIRANCIDVFGNPDNTIDRIIQEIEKAPTVLEATE